MEIAVSAALRRLRAADIIRMAGLTTASLGQEYSRTEAVHSTQCQGVSISGVVDISHTTHISPLSLIEGIKDVNTAETPQRVYTVSVEMPTSTSWISKCSCAVNVTNP